MAPLSHWDLVGDLHTINTFKSLNIGRITKILPRRANEQFRASISIRASANYLVTKSPKVSEADLEEDMRVGLNGKSDIVLPLPPAVDPTVSLMQIDERPTTTYADIGGCGA